MFIEEEERNRNLEIFASENLSAVRASRVQIPPTCHESEIVSNSLEKDHETASPARLGRVFDWFIQHL